MSDFECDYISRTGSGSKDFTAWDAHASSSNQFL